MCFFSNPGKPAYNWICGYSEKGDIRAQTAEARREGDKKPALKMQGWPRWKMAETD